MLPSSLILGYPSVLMPPGMTCCLLGLGQVILDRNQLAHDLLRDFSERPVYQLGEERAGAH